LTDLLINHKLISL